MRRWFVVNYWDGDGSDSYHMVKANTRSEALGLALERIPWARAGDIYITDIDDLECDWKDM